MSGLGSLVQSQVCLGKCLPRSGVSPCVPRVFYLNDSSQRFTTGMVGVYELQTPRTEDGRRSEGCKSCCTPSTCEENRGGAGGRR